MSVGIAPTIEVLQEEGLHTMTSATPVASSSVGQVGVRVIGDGPLAHEIRRRLAPMPQIPQCAVQVTFHIPPYPATTLTDPPGSHRARAWAITRQKDAQNGMQLQMDAIVPQPIRVLPPEIFRFAHPAHQSQVEYLGSLFATEVLLGITQILGLPLGQTYMHAAILKRREEVVGVVAGGAMGKTGTSLRLCVESNWEFLSDDLAVINSQGKVAPSWKEIEVSPRNLTGAPGLEFHLLASRSKADVMAWKIRKRLRPRGLRREVAAAALLGPRALAAPSALTTLIVLRRAPVEHCSLDRIDAGSAAQAASEETERELSHYLPALAAALSRPARPGLPGSLDVFKAAFRNAECFLLEVPEQAGEGQIEDVLMRVLETDRAQRQGLELNIG